MARTLSAMVPLGSPMPDFRLHRLDGGVLEATALRTGWSAPGLLVAFVSLHCPYVQHIRPRLGQRLAQWMAEGLRVLVVHSNDPEAYPDDAPAAVRSAAAREAVPWPDLLDEDQSAAVAFRAACTPDFFLYDGALTLAYRGRFCASRPRQDGPPPSGDDLDQAVQAVRQGRAAPLPQHASMGCNLKWRPGREPAYAAGCLAT